MASPAMKADRNPLHEDRDRYTVEYAGCQTEALPYFIAKIHEDNGNIEASTPAQANKNSAPSSSQSLLAVATTPTVSTSTKSSIICSSSVAKDQHYSTSPDQPLDFSAKKVSPEWMSTLKSFNMSPMHQRQPLHSIIPFHLAQAAAKITTIAPVSPDSMGSEGNSLNLSISRGSSSSSPSPDDRAADQSPPLISPRPLVHLLTGVKEENGMFDYKNIPVGFPCPGDKGVLQNTLANIQHQQHLAQQIQFQQPIMNLSESPMMSIMKKMQTGEFHNSNPTYLPPPASANGVTPVFSNNGPVQFMGSLARSSSGLALEDTNPESVLNRLNLDSQRKYMEFKEKAAKKEKEKPKRKAPATKRKGASHHANKSNHSTQKKQQSGEGAVAVYEKSGSKPSKGKIIKDVFYWTRREKNNEAAKRSRDARKAKEKEIATRAEFLEEENVQLKFELVHLQAELLSLRNKRAFGWLGAAAN